MRATSEAVRVEAEDRREQLIATTIDALAEFGYVGTTLARIGARAGVSPGLVAHYFGDKDGLLAAAFRALSRRVAESAAKRLAAATTARERLIAVIDANLAPEEFNRRTAAAWLAFWGQVPHVHGLGRVQAVYQGRLLSNLRHALRPLLPERDVARVAASIAALIDGVWLRAALSNFRESDSATARAILTDFVERRLA